ncbi:GNAT family N-acetyltransferase [Lichenihabitans psoromatis]|uniref:GNAT family N-acetyltransferase n=1 Tax=Lichenihabitans psoromatis TaxID=2528642 RepID=UPI001FE05D05|nr:GNAT family N-acetyltransferase [Lichenihabitans psoromatis]
MADRMSGATLRPMLPTDGPMLASIFQASVETLTEEDYSDDQREAWAALADTPDFAKRLTGGLTLVASLAGEPVGFAVLEGKDKIGMLYVAPDLARQGVATMLCDALQRIAAGRGTAKLIVDASDTARDFFMVRGFVPMVRNMVSVGGEWLGNTTMEFDLVAAGLNKPADEAS